MGSFEWDPEKDKLNIEKHGVSLAAGIPVFDGLYRFDQQPGKSAVSMNKMQGSNYDQT